ncbi:MAG: hypothetical protein JNJ91_06080 [Flavobacteriales bacterium]|nr:hypothetical protein [Flavobacteriales bacterium]
MELANRIWGFAKRQPKDALILLLLIFFFILTIIFWLRLNGQQIRLPFLEQYIKVVSEGTPNTITAKQLNEYSRIVGKYKYRCKSKVKNHGGVCEISLVTTANGLQWKLQGNRLWEEVKDTSGKVVKQVTLDIPYQWQTSWGDFISDHRIAYTYEITKEDTHLKGYAEGEVLDDNNVKGNYWQLPPNEPLFGSFEFRRQTTHFDTTW